MAAALSLQDEQLATAALVLMNTLLIAWAHYRMSRSQNDRQQGRILGKPRFTRGRHRHHKQR